MYFYKNKILTHNDSIWVRIRRDKNVKNNNFSRISKRKVIPLFGKKLLIISSLFGKKLLIIENILKQT